MTSPRREATYDRQRQRDGARPTQPGPVRVGHGDAGTRPSGAEGDPVEATDEEDRIGPYLIRDEVGRGSFATVFRGERCVRRAPPLRCDSELTRRDRTRTRSWRSRA